MFSILQFGFDDFSPTDLTTVGVRRHVIPYFPFRTQLLGCSIKGQTEEICNMCFSSCRTGSFESLFMLTLKISNAIIAQD